MNGVQLEDKPDTGRKTLVLLIKERLAVAHIFAELGQILGVIVWWCCSSSTIPQSRGDPRLAMTVIKVARGGGRGKGGQTFCNDLLMGSHD